jgi:cytochrome c oxidase assembly factor 4
MRQFDEKLENSAEIDPIEETGCSAENDLVLLCYADTKDWRKCQKELDAFRKCMKKYEDAKLSHK